MDFKLDHFESYNDIRGKLVVFLKESELQTEQKHFGQIYFITFSNSGIVRGNHYHKKWREWFGIVQGRIEAVVEDVRTKERQSSVLDAAKDGYVRLQTGPYIAHAFRCISNSAALLNYANGEWDPEDNIPYTVIQ